MSEVEEKPRKKRRRWRMAADERQARRALMNAAFRIDSGYVRALAVHEERKAKNAQLALAFMLLLGSVNLVVDAAPAHVFENSTLPALIGLYNKLLQGAFWLTALVFIQWLRLAVRSANSLGLLPAGKERIRFSVSRATWAWLIPVLNWFRPCSVVAELRELSNPNLLPDFDDSEQNVGASYRQSAVMRRHPLRIHGRRAPVGLWWGTFLPTLLLSGVVYLGSPALTIAYRVLDLSAALTAILVVRHIHFNRRELYRRYAHWAAVVGPG